MRSNSEHNQTLTTVNIWPRSNSDPSQMLTWSNFDHVVKLWPLSNSDHGQTLTMVKLWHGQTLTQVKLWPWSNSDPGQILTTVKLWPRSNSDHGQTLTQFKLWPWSNYDLSHDASRREYKEDVLRTQGWLMREIGRCTKRTIDRIRVF